MRVSLVAALLNLRDRLPPCVRLWKSFFKDKWLYIGGDTWDSSVRICVKVVFISLRSLQIHSFHHPWWISSDKAFEAKKVLILCRQAETRVKRRNRGILMYVCMWRTADPLENTGRLSLHVFVLWPFCDWPVVSADCLPQLLWRGKALEGMDGTVNQAGKRSSASMIP